MSGILLTDTHLIVRAALPSCSAFHISAFWFCREHVSSGALTLDIALGGGFPKGRIIEVRRPSTLPCSVCVASADLRDMQLLPAICGIKSLYAQCCASTAWQSLRGSLMA